MCRHLAAISTNPLPVAELLFDAPHALAVQARRPRLQVWGDSNPDGWGVAWYPDESAEPKSYRTVTPIWDDATFATRVGGVTTTTMLAAARLASPGATVDERGNAPFVSGRWSFSLNGIVDGFAEGVGDALRAQVEPTRLAAITSDADTEVLFALVLQHLAAGVAPADALRKVIRQVTALTTGRLNLLLTDGHEVYGTRFGNSLFRLGTRVLASEPFDDQPAWREVPDRSVVVAGPGGGYVAGLETHA
jgi:glutamine amidotransferase